jgi:hypothetical protein
VCEDLADFHFEVKCVERLNIEDAMAQARHDARRKLPLVAHRRSHCGWLVTMDAPTFFRILRGDLPAAAASHADYVADLPGQTAQPIFPAAASADPQPPILATNPQTDAASKSLPGTFPNVPQL